MMTILIIEDEISKERRIVNFLREAFPIEKLEVKHSVMSGEDAMQDHQFDLVLLDMSLPLYDHDDNNVQRNDSNEFDTFGGLVILDEMDRCNSPSKVIVITAFDILGEGRHRIDLQGLNKQMKIDYGNMVLDTVFYDSSSVRWRERIRTIILENWNDDLRQYCTASAKKQSSQRGDGSGTVDTEEGGSQAN